MSSNYHTPIVVGANGNAATFNTPLGQLDAAITGLTSDGITFSIVDKTTLTADGTIDIMSIPSTYTRLVLIMELRSDRASTDDDVHIKFNNDAVAANYYSVTQRRASGGSAFTENLGATGAVVLRQSATGTTSPADWLATVIVDITQYAGATDFKMCLIRCFNPIDSGVADMLIVDGGGLWVNNADAINRITIEPVTGANFKAGSTYKLEGVL